ncbi:hypothetical protein Lal_00024346 [Lupinus albus]|nr:hypothetical protein Lal_00024346 [Lupinus albus]
MEKQMEAGKFVEGLEASTAVKESFTHPRNHIPIPEGIINTQDAVVSIDISIEDDALLPIPLDEDIITVGLALATFVAWPNHLIDIVPIMGKVSADDHSATSPPRIDELASKKAKVFICVHKSQLVAKIIEENKEIADLFFAPLNTGFPSVVICFRCGMDNYHNKVIYFRYGREDPINNKSTAPDIFNNIVF